MKRFAFSTTYTIIGSWSQSEASLMSFCNSKKLLHSSSASVSLQSQRHTYYICAFRVKDACTCIFCFHQTLWNMVVSYRYADCFSAL